MKKVCKYCGKEYEPKRKGPQGKKQKYCSRKCMGLASRSLRKRSCKHCGSIFMGGKSNQKYCSKKCFDNYQRVYKGTIKKCLQCGSEFKIKNKTRKYCSKNCYLKYLLKYKYNGPAYNKYSIKWFKKFDKILKTDGYYATKNDGEYYIDDLRYFLDYYNQELKIIIEWDEERHYCNNELLEKDVIRQNNIINKLPNFTFLRIRESKINKDINIDVIDFIKLNNIGAI